MNDQWITIKQAAALIGKTDLTIRRMIKKYNLNVQN